VSAAGGAGALTTADRFGATGAVAPFAAVVEGGGITDGTALLLLLLLLLLPRRPFSGDGMSSANWRSAQSSSQPVVALIPAS